MSLQIEKQALFERDLRGGFNLFLGAGFSRLATNSGNNTLPTGEDLKGIIVKEFELERYETLDLPSVYQIVVGERRQRLHALLKTLFTVKSYDERYDNLRKSDVRAIYTTNIDDLVYNIFSPRDGTVTKILHDRALSSAPKSPSSVIDYIPLHGCVRHEDPRYVFTSGEISSAFAADQETWYVFQRELQIRPTIFVGYAMKDAGVLQALHSSRNQSVNGNRWIVLRDSDLAAQDLFRSLNFEILKGDTAAFLDSVKIICGGSDSNFSGSARPPSYGAIPKFGASAQRPVRNFFLGATPEWSDAYSTQVVKRRLFSDVKNAVLSGENAILVGVPLSGKTTLLVIAHLG